MVNPQRKSIITGNWKMYKTIEEGLKFIQGLIPLVQSDELPLVYLAVPYTMLESASKITKNTKVTIGAQNMNDASEGAFTGEIAARMLKEAGAQFVILGHSERRTYFHEDNAFINKKVKRATQENLPCVLCIGESEEEREAGLSFEVIQKQLLECFNGLTQKDILKCMVAYEPKWAIGTGKTATAEIAQEMHHHCRQFVGENWGEDIANKMIIQYGGSVKPENAKALMEQPDIDGLLVGGASLSLDFFSQIVNYNTSTV